MSAKFSPSEAAVSVFGFMRAQPSFAMRYIAIYAVIFTFAIYVAYVGGYFDAVKKLLSIIATNPHPSEEMVMNAFAQLNFSVILIGGIALWIATLVLLASGLRKTVRNEDTGILGLQIGNDEKQLLIAALFFALISALASVPFSLLRSVFPAATMIANVGETCMNLYIGGRLGLYGVLTIANGRSSVKETFNFTKPDFWNYVGAYFLSGVIAIIILAIYLAVVLMLGNSFAGENGIKLATLSTSSMIISLFVGLGIGFTNLMFVCVGSYAYHQIKGQ